MKRDKRIASLSRDHFHGLLVARQIRKAKEGNKRELLSQMVEQLPIFWEKDLKKHFQAEEEILIPAVQSVTESCEEEIDHILKEHKKMEGLIGELRSENSTDDSIKKVTRFGNLIYRHIRFEEDIFFPKVESILPEEELERVGRELDGVR